MIRATFAGFTTALSALRSNQKKLDVTGQNLANMTTEGYTRQQLQTSSINYQNPTSFYMNENDVNVGFGVSMDYMTQLRDQFLDSQYREQNGYTEYNSTVNDALTTLSGFMDETKLEGLRSSFDDIQEALTNMQDPAKVNDPVYEGELRSRMQATTNLFNNTANKIQTAMKNEYENIDGTGSSSNGYADRINQLLADIGDLNVKIKHNQLLGNPALELQDERNLKIDELSGYIPIEVSYYTEKYEYTNTDGTTTTRDRGLNYDSFGNAIGKSSFPDDLKIELVYSQTDAEGKNPTEGRVTLVNGSDIRDDDGNLIKNYGSVDIYVDGSRAYNDDGTRNADTYYDGKVNPDTNQVQQVQLKFNKAENYAFNATTGKDSNGNTARNQVTDIMTDNHVEIDSDNPTNSNYSTVRLASGSVQASLDMLSDSASSLANDSVYRSYDYYMNRLDNLASTFALQMNRFNQMGSNGNYEQDITTANRTTDGYSLTADELTALEEASKTDSSLRSFLLLVNSGVSDGTKSQTASDITAANIGVSKNWVNQTTHIGTYGDPAEGNSGTDTVLHMLQSMSSSLNALGNRSYADEMNSISTYLATDAYNNSNSLNTNQSVLDGISTSKDQLSGVSLDEEAANMMTYVTSYNAAARLMSSLDEMLQTLIGIGS